MASSKYKLFAAFFNFYRLLFNVNNNMISMVFVHKGHIGDNLRCIYDELNQKDDDLRYNILSKDEYNCGGIKSFTSFLKKIIQLLVIFFIKSYKLAISRYIFLDDNFLPMVYMNISPNTTVIQLWHGAGAFKKFGLSSTTDPSLIFLQKQISNKLDYVIVSSENVALFYEEAFGVSKEKILPLGVPKTDYYFKINNLEELKKKFEDRYPDYKDKKLVLYAPTFRENSEHDKNILQNFDIPLFNMELGDQYVLAVRLHPKVNSADFSSNDNLINVTDYEDERELLLLADILITDYSSIMVEYALLNKPIIFFPYDYEYYVQKERGFYFNYWEDVPGPIACSIHEVIKIIKENSFDLDKIKRFAKQEYDELDGKSTQRVINYIINNNL